jgi:hypothetical protein
MANSERLGGPLAKMPKWFRDELEAAASARSERSARGEVEDSTPVGRLPPAGGSSRRRGLDGIPSGGAGSWLVLGSSRVGEREELLSELVPAMESRGHRSGVGNDGPLERVMNPREGAASPQ